MMRLRHGFEKNRMDNIWLLSKYLNKLNSTIIIDLIAIIIIINPWVGSFVEKFIFYLSFSFPSLS